MLGATLAAVAAGAGTAWAAGPLLRRSPEPVDCTDKPCTYAELATPRFRTGVGLVAAAATLTACTFIPGALLPIWLAGSTLGVLVAVVDGTLTWVPPLLSHLTWAAAALALGCVGLLGGSWAIAGLVAAVALAVSLAFLLVWRITYPNLGFADVRFAPVAAAIGSSTGLSSLFASVLCTTVIAGSHLLVRQIGGRRGLQPYIPAMLAGPFLAEIVSVLIR